MQKEKIEASGSLDINFNFGAISVNFNIGRDELLFDVGPEFDLLQKNTPSLKGFTVAYLLKDNKGLHLKIKGVSKHGNPVDFKTEDISVKSSDESILSCTEDTGVVSITPVGPLGTAQVQISVPGVLVAGVPLSGSFDITVVGGDAATLSFEPADTFDLDPAPAPNV